MSNKPNGVQEIWSAERVKELTMSKITNNSDTHEIIYKRRKRSFFKTAASFAAAAAVLCLMVLGGTLLMPQDRNAFELTAYALEQQDDGSIEQRQVDLVNETNSWSYRDDGENVYINVWLKCDGENIERVDFYVDEGFFATQYIRREKGNIVTECVPMSGVTVMELGDNYTDGSLDITITQYGNDFVIVGNHFTLNADDMTEDLLVFWGRESRRVGNDLNLPSELTISAVATFSDGKTQEEVLLLDLSLSKNQSFGVISHTDEEIEQSMVETLKYLEFLYSIPLEQCEIVPGSEQFLTYGDTFEYEIIDNSGFSATGMHVITEDSMDSASDVPPMQEGFYGMFDMNGVARFGASVNLHNLWDEYDGSDGYISVIEPNGDGTFTGKTYKIPGWLILELMN